MTEVAESFNVNLPIIARKKAAIDTILDGEPDDDQSEAYAKKK